MSSAAAAGSAVPPSHIALTPGPATLRALSTVEAIEVAGVKDDILHTADSIIARIDALCAGAGQERVNFDMKRSALARAVIATETSLYDRQVLEKELLGWAARYAPDASSSSSSSASDDDEDDEAEAEAAVAAALGTGGGARDVFEESERKRRIEERGERRELLKIARRDDSGADTNKRKRHRRGNPSKAANNSIFDEFNPLSVASRRIAEQQEEESIDPMFSILSEKEGKITTATAALSSFTKRILAMYRAFLKIHARSDDQSSTLAVKMFEAETLRQLHLMESATNSAHTGSAAAAHRLQAQRDRAADGSGSGDGAALKRQLALYREKLAATLKKEREQADKIVEQENRCDILELAAKELTRTVHQLRGEVRAHEEAEARRQAAARERRRQLQLENGSGSGGTSMQDDGSVLDEDSYSAMQGHRGSAFFGNSARRRQSSYLSIGDDDPFAVTPVGGGDDGSAARGNTRYVRVANPRDHRRCHMIANVLSFALKKARANNRDLERQLDRLAPGDPAAATAATSGLGAASSPPRRYRSVAAVALRGEGGDFGAQFCASSTDAATQTDVPNPFAERDDAAGITPRNRRGTVVPGAASAAPDAATASAAAAPSGGAPSSAASRSARPFSARLAASSANSALAPSSSLNLFAGAVSNGDLETVPAASLFFDSLADVLQVDKNDVARPRALRKLVQTLDQFLTARGEGGATVSIPLRKAIMRVRDWALREKVASVQERGRGFVAAMLASQYAAVGQQRTSGAAGSGGAASSGFHIPVAPQRKYAGRVDDRDVHVARPHAAASTRPHVSESALRDDLPRAKSSSDDDDDFGEVDGEDSLLMMSVMGVSASPNRASASTAAAAAASQPQPRQLHPGIDNRMREAYVARAAESRANAPTQPRDSRPWSARYAQSARELRSGVSGGKAPTTSSRFA